MADQNIFLTSEVKGAITLLMSSFSIWLMNSIRTWFNSKTEIRNDQQEDKASEDAVLAVEKIQDGRKKTNQEVMTYDTMKDMAVDYAKTLVPKADEKRLRIKVEAALLRLEAGPVAPLSKSDDTSTPDGHYHDPVNQS